MRAAKDQNVPKIYDARKNGFTCLNNRDTTTKVVFYFYFHYLFLTSGDSPEVQSRDAIPKRTITLLYATS